MKNVSPKIGKPFLRHGVAGAAICIGLVMPAHAQEDTAGDGDNVIIVTGSRIRAPNLESTVPITSVTGDEFFQTGQVSVGDVLNELPALRSNFSQQNSTRFLGTAGLSLLDLRGLGTQRTLVLQNGRRHVGADVLINAVSVDINQIPTDLIERVDVVTGGDSAIYGSDAIAGVVNFILKDDYEGLQLRGQSGVSKYGDAGSQYISALAGTNFSDGRGNIAANFEYANQTALYASQRKHYRTLNTFATVDDDSDGDIVNGSNGIPDRTFIRDYRYPYYANGGTFLAFNGSNPDLPYDSYIFQPDGSLALQTGDHLGVSPFGFYQGGNGDNFRDGKQFGLRPSVKRYTANILGHYEISPAFVPFFEAKYVRTDSLANNSGPFFFSGGTTGSPRERFYTDNPFLRADTLNQIRQLYGDYYDAAGDANSDGIPDADQFGFTILKNAVDLGNRLEKAKRETYRIVGGVKGDISEKWHYELSANYGQFKEATKILGNVNVQRFLLAIDAVTDPSTGNVVCRSQIDPSAAQPYEFPQDEAFAAAQLANDVASCVPVNFFGSGNVSSAARKYLTQDTTSRGKITQFDVTGFLSGDTTGWFELPGGPIGVAIGFEYRRETVKYVQDPLVESGLTFYNAIPTFSPPSFEVKELFGEIRLPILADKPFFKSLTVTGAGRVSDYKGATGTVYAYNGGVEWAPIRDIRFRANYARAVRAPNLADLYTPQGVNFADAPDDPCSARNINSGGPERVTNCAAAGIPSSYDFVYTQSLELRSGGNPQLKEETSDSYIFGAVLEPSFMPGFSISADYYNIKVNKVITSPSAQQILDACYDSASLDNQFCGLFQRAGAGGGPRGEEPFQVLEGSLQAVLLNYAKLKVRGVDVNAGYRRSIASIGDFSTEFKYTHVFQNDEYLFPNDPTRANQLLLELSYPKDAFNWDVNLKTGPVTIGYQMRYIGKMVLNEYEDFFSKQGRAPENEDYADRRFYPSVFYHDIRLGLDVTERMNIYFGVDNVFNKLPPFGASGTGEGTGMYGNIGRFFYLGAVAKF